MARRGYRGGLWSDHGRLLCHGRSLILSPAGPTCASKVVSTFSLHFATHELSVNHRRYWEATHLVTGQSRQFSWVGPQHLVHEASQIWQWPCSSMYSPGGTKCSCLLHFYMAVFPGLSVWEQPDLSVAAWKPWRQPREKRPWMASVASAKSWPYNNNCSSPRGPESWNLKKLWGNDIILNLVKMCYKFYK